jgi:transcriptional regulator with XRE-family HTH domain
MPKTTRPRTRSIFASNLRRLMKARGESQMDLAKRAHVSQKQISNILSGASAPTTETAEALARACGMPAWALMIRELPAADIQRLAIDKMVGAFLDSPTETQVYILSVARREAKA